MPCKVVRVRKNSVDVEIQGMEDSGFGYYVKFPQLLDLPVIYNNYTAKAYIITPIQVGDTGLVEFLDFNASGFSDSGNTAISSGRSNIKYRREDLAKIADTLLQFDKIEASFVVGKLGNGNIGISARSLGNINVGKILEHFNGGGDENEG